jgi:hypothetical protein
MMPCLYSSATHSSACHSLALVAACRAGALRDESRTAFEHAASASGVEPFMILFFLALLGVSRR